MHAFLIAMCVYGLLALLGLAMSLRDGDGATWSALIANGICISLCLWAFALLVRGN
jgi:hypothetical protein